MLGFRGKRSQIRFVIKFRRVTVHKVKEIGFSSETVRIVNAQGLLHNTYYW